MDRARRFRIYHTQEDADDAPTYIAHVGSNDPWQCEYCHHLNPASERSCQTCGHPRRDPPEREEP